jgi:molybdenum cofactor cytidylyltransferase
MRPCRKVALAAECRQESYGKSSIRLAPGARLPPAAGRAQTAAVQSFDGVLRTIILAAGASSRMGRPKSTLPIGRAGETFLSRIVSTMLRAGLPEIIVVTGAHTDVARTTWPSSDARVRFIENPAWPSGQLSSLLAGLDAPAVVPMEGAVVTLVDIPLVSVETVTQLISIWRRERPPIVRPARPSADGAEEHGHPVIFDASIFDDLRRADAQQGAKSVVRANAARIVNVPIDDPGAYLDVDTPEQYGVIDR